MLAPAALLRLICERARPLEQPQLKSLAVDTTSRRHGAAEAVGVDAANAFERDHDGDTSLPGNARKRGRARATEEQRNQHQRADQNDNHDEHGALHPAILPCPATSPRSPAANWLSSHTQPQPLHRGVTRR